MFKPLTTRLGPGLTGWVSGCVTALAAVAIAPAHGAGAADAPVTVRVVAEAPGVTPGGTVWVGVHLQTKDGWHTYWPGQNNTGMPTQIRPTGPEGVAFDEPVWPAPRRLLASGGMAVDHVFQGPVAALIAVTAPADAEVGSGLELRFDVSWMACEVMCVAGDDSVTLTLPVLAEAPEPDAGVAELFAATRRRVPEPVPSTERVVLVECTANGATIRARGATRLAFYPDGRGTRIGSLVEMGVAEGDMLRLEFHKDRDPADPLMLSGVLEVFSHDGRSRVYRVRKAPEMATNG